MKYAQKQQRGREGGREGVRVEQSLSRINVYFISTNYVRGSLREEAYKPHIIANNQVSDVVEKPTDAHTGTHSHSKTLTQTQFSLWNVRKNRTKNMFYVQILMGIFEEYVRALCVAFGCVLYVRVCVLYVGLLSVL